jgi:CRP/FNR family transcriptional regulator, cyclic AMP receptor protein
MPKRIRKDAKVALLTKVDLLSGCTKKEIQEIASLSTEWDAKAGQVLAKQGERGSEFFIIIDGTATASRNGVQLAELVAADFFGELALLDGGPRTATVVAETDMHLLVLSSTEFRQLCQAYPLVGYRMLKALGSRLRHADEIIGTTNNKDAPLHVTV